MLRSRDGVTWEPVRAFPGSGPGHIIVSNGRLLAAGVDPRPYLAVSGNGEAWTTYELPAPETVQGSGAIQIYTYVSAVGGEAYVAADVTLLAVIVELYDLAERPSAHSRWVDGVLQMECNPSCDEGVQPVEIRADRSEDVLSLGFARVDTGEVLEEMTVRIPPEFDEWAVEELVGSGKLEVIWRVEDSGAVAMMPQQIAPNEEIRQILTVGSSTVAFVAGYDGDRILTLSGDEGSVTLPPEGFVTGMWTDGEVLIADVTTGVAQMETWALSGGQWSRVPGVELAISYRGPLGWVLAEPGGTRAVYSPDGKGWADVSQMVPEFPRQATIYSVAVGPDSVVIYLGDGSDDDWRMWLLIGTVS